MLHIDSISKTFDGKVILDNVNLKIGNSELKILKGKNGSGKTTFLKIIASLMSFNSGKIFFNDIWVMLQVSTSFYPPYRILN